MNGNGTLNILRVQDEIIFDLLGEPPFVVAPSLPAAEAILDLPPMGLDDGDQHCISYLFANLEANTLRRLVKLMMMDRRLRARLTQLRKNFAGINQPGARSWEAPAPDEILEEIVLNAGHIRGLLFTIDGTRFVVLDDPVTLVTLLEYKTLFGQTIDAALAEHASRQADLIRRAHHLCRVRPTRFSIDVANSEMQMDSREILAFDTDQLKTYARRNGLTLMDVHPVSPQGKPND